MSTDKVHNVTSLNDPAPEAPPVDTSNEAAKAPGRIKNFLLDKKMFFIGLAAGAAVAGGAVALANASDEEEETTEPPQD